jgi:hypothetical protein
MYDQVDCSLDYVRMCLLSRIQCVRIAHYMGNTILKVTNTQWTKFHTSRTSILERRNKAIIIMTCGI